MMRSLLALFILLCTVEPSLAQKSKLVSAGISANAYRGDLTKKLEKWSSVFHLGIKFNTESRLNGNVNLAFGFVTGENPNYQFDNGQVPLPTPNRFFRSPVFILNYELNYNLYTWKNITFYISQGVGLLRFNPQDEFFDDFQDQPATRAASETFSNITLMLPTQFGALYLFPNDFGVSFQAGFINSLTDYLDNISDWGIKSGTDNVFATRFSFHVPLGNASSQ